MKLAIKTKSEINRGAFQNTLKTDWLFELHVNGHQLESGSEGNNIDPPPSNR